MLSMNECTLKQIQSIFLILVQLHMLISINQLVVEVCLIKYLHCSFV